MFAALFSLTALVGPTAHAAAPCEARATALDLRAGLQEAEGAFGALEVERFTEAMDDVVFLVPCIGEVVSAEDAGRLHRLQGLRQFVADDEERAVASFAASRAAAPDVLLPTWLVPEGSGIRDLFGRMPLENGETATQPRPLTGSLIFDGVGGVERPVRWPTLVQVLDEDGRVVESDYLFPGDAMPTYPMAPDERVAGSGPRRLPRSVGIGLTGAAVGSALGAGVLYGLATGAAADFEADHPEWDEGDLLRARSRANNLVVTSGALGAAALGVGLTAALVVRW